MLKNFLLVWYGWNNLGCFYPWKLRSNNLELAILIHWLSTLFRLTYWYEGKNSDLLTKFRVWAYKTSKLNRFLSLGFQMDLIVISYFAFLGNKKKEAVLRYFYSNNPESIDVIKWQCQLYFHSYKFNEVEPTWLVEHCNAKLYVILYITSTLT